MNVMEDELQYKENDCVIYIGRDPYGYPEFGAKKEYNDFKKEKKLSLKKELTTLELLQNS